MVCGYSKSILSTFLFNVLDTGSTLQKALARRRNNRINDYMNKTARRVIDYCIDHDVGTLVVGYNETFQKDSNIGKRNNQTFVNIPFGLLRDKLEYLCELNGIILVMQEES
ncbi:IS200/IS605 family accessory protein TnpB-related protein [Catenibacterium mitsuokai]|uniref:IS200/IS605 family accessory protein TnpB-related protein n=1 Tax=Catenibacterium mitsuokai TaxID=100886 RepID=UPI001EE93798|nr:IS200/IS605 family accessory protein TnpB-related protein [Catenibacterium mitsuokai]